MSNCVNCVKSSTDVEQDKDRHQSFIWCCKKVISDFHECCFCTMMSSKSWLKKSPKVYCIGGSHIIAWQWYHIQTKRLRIWRAANPQKLHFSFRPRWPEFLGQCSSWFAHSFCLVSYYLPSFCLWGPRIASDPQVEQEDFRSPVALHACCRFQGSLPSHAPQHPRHNTYLFF